MGTRLTNSFWRKNWYNLKAYAECSFKKVEKCCAWVFLQEKITHSYRVGKVEIASACKDVGFLLIPCLNILQEYFCDDL